MFQCSGLFIVHRRHQGAVFLEFAIKPVLGNQLLDQINTVEADIKRVTPIFGAGLFSIMGQTWKVRRTNPRHPRRQQR